MVFGDKAPGSCGFPIAYLWRIWTDIKEDVMAFMQEFHSRGKFPENLRATFIAFIPKISSLRNEG